MEITVTFPVTSINYIDASASTTVYKNPSPTLVGRDSNGYEKWSYFRFDGFTLPDNCNILSAKVVIKKVSGSTVRYDYDVNYPTAYWNPDTLTWNNRTGYTVSTGTAFSMSAYGVYNVNVTPIVKAWYTNKYNYGLFIKQISAANGTIIQIAGWGDVDAPYLEVTYGYERVLFQDGNDILEAVQDFDNPLTYSADLTSTSYAFGTPYSFSNSPDQSFDNNTSSGGWSSVDNTNMIRNIWVGQNFPTKRHIRLLTYRGTASAYGPSSFMVQRSDDGTNWIDVQQCDVPYNTNPFYLEFKLPITEASYKWRITPLTQSPTNKWSILELEMKEALTFPRSFRVIGQAPATEDMFMNHGMPIAGFADISKDKYNALSSLKVLRWYSYTPTVSVQSKYTGVPVTRVVKASGDIALDRIDRIDGFSLTSTESAAGKLRIVASSDKGQTWKTLKMTSPISQDMNHVASYTASTNPQSAQLAFDGNPDTGWRPATHTEAWVQVTFKQPVRIKTYLFRQSITYETQAWVFEGSNDGVAWTPLDTQNWQPAIGPLYAFQVATPDSYLHYRFRLTQWNAKIWGYIPWVRDLLLFEEPAFVWEDVNIQNASEVLAKGMDAWTFNNHASGYWGDLVGTEFGGIDKKTIRFAYALDISSVTDGAYTAKLTMQVDKRGTWEAARLNTEYDVEYDIPDQMRVKIYINGDVKINYKL